MSTKPDITESRWAVDILGTTEAANIAAPTDSERDSGYAFGAVPTSSVWNYLLLKHWRWFEFLSSSLVDFEGAGLEANVFRTNSIQAAEVAPIVISGDIHHIDGDLATDGAVSAEGPISANGGLVVTGDADFSAANLLLPPSSTFLASATHAVLSSGTALLGDYWTGGASGVVRLTIDCVPVGHEITGIDVLYRRGGGTPQFDFVEITYSTVGASLGTLSVAAGGADATTALGTFTPTTVAAGKAYAVIASIGNASDRFYGVVVHSRKAT